MVERRNLALAVEPPDMTLEIHRDLAAADDPPGVPNRHGHNLTAVAYRQRLEVSELQGGCQILKERDHVLLADARFVVRDGGVADSLVPLHVVCQLIEDRGNVTASECLVDLGNSAGVVCHVIPPVDRAYDRPMATLV